MNAVGYVDRKMTYRNDLEAALTRNHYLERENRELRQALDARAAPSLPPRESGVAFARPATYWALVRGAARYAQIMSNSVIDARPRIRPPKLPSSDILLLDLLRWPAIALALPFIWVGRLIWFLLVLLYWLVVV